MRLPHSDLPLSPRESEILLLAADGNTDKQICQRLSISQSTISTYWTRLRDKLGASSRPEAIAKALARAYSQSIEELRQTQMWFDLFLEAADDYAIFATDPDGLILSWNPGVFRVLGFNKDEFVGQNIATLFTPPDLAQHAPEREREIARDNGRSIDNRWHTRKDGVRLWCAGSLFALKDDEGEVRWYAKVIRDDTESRQVHEEAEALRMRLEELLTQQPSRS
jgi:PAS domain S-box-containing protein